MFPLFRIVLRFIYQLGTKPFLKLQLTAVIITLGIATSIAFTVMKNREDEAPLRLLVVKSVQESTADTVVIFQTDQKGRLSRNHKNYQYLLKLVQESSESQRPVGVRVDSAGEITEIARSDNDFIHSLADESEDKVRVVFQGHDGIAHLERQHPRFGSIERDLYRALREKKRIWFVWRLPRLTLEDVMIIE